MNSSKTTEKRNDSNNRISLQESVREGREHRGGGIRKRVREPGNWTTTLELAQAHLISNPTTYKMC